MKNKEILYIISGIILAVLLIIAIVMQVQNKQKQEELQKQQESLEYEMKQNECVSKCTLSWKKEYGTCEEIYETLKKQNVWPSESPKDFNCDKSYPNNNGGCDCECSCFLDYKYTLN